MLMRSSSLLRLVLALGVSIICLAASAQTAKLPGKVLEENGDPIPGATVRFKNQRGGVITSQDGSFLINTTGKGTLVISALGFLEKEVEVNGTGEIKVSLAKNNKQMDEVVVTAYGIKRDKNTLPYAAQTISG